MLTIYTGNALGIVPILEKNSVHCSVTSPPYYSLRKYAGDQQCDWPEVEYAPMPGLPLIKVEAMTCALGHEPTIEAYIGHLVAIYREVYKILRDDGVAWCVMGDSFCSQGGPEPAQTKWQVSGASDGQAEGKSRKVISGLKQGDLMMVPHRLALALQGDGWLVRNDNVWKKLAPMPESVRGWSWQRHRIKVKSGRYDSEEKQVINPTGAGFNQRYRGEEGWATKWQDCPGCEKCEPNGGFVLRKGSWRHTRAHEFVFMLSKGMQYWSDQEAVREELAESSIDKMNQATLHGQTGGPKDYGSGSNRSARKMLENLEQSRNGRNPRSVLMPKPEPFSGAHFAVFPTSLVEPLIKATCPTKCCPVCGMGWSPVVQREKTGEILAEGSLKTSKKSRRADVPGSVVTNPDSMFRTGTWHKNNILGYRPSCGCGRDDHVPGIVLDIFVGSGTTLLVADRLGLDGIGIDISQSYAMDIAKPRIEGDAPLLTQVELVTA